MANDEELPEHVQAEVDAIKRQEGIATTEDGNFTDETVQEAAPPPPPPKSRRAQERAEEAERVKAAEDRAAKAEAAVAEVRREAAERHARLEGLIEAGNQHRQQPIYVQPAPGPAPPPKDYSAERRTALREAQKALAGGDYDGWQEHQDKANALQVEEMMSRRMAEFEQRQPQQQQAPQQKPIWLTAVENQFSDVLAHAKGPGTVAAFMQMEGIGPQNFNAETMQKAFVRARKELGLSSGAPAPTEQQRQVHAGGAVNGSSRPAASNGASKSVNVPKNWREIARRAGMTEAQYLRAAKDM